MKAPTETQLVKACLQFLALRKITAWRNNSGGAKLAGHGGRGQFVRFGHKGSSDILGVLAPHGRLLACEVKKPGGKLTEHQKQFLDCVRAAGGLALVVRDVRELQAALDAEGL